MATCITGVIQCAYPGDGKTTNGDPNCFDDYNGNESGYYKDSMGKVHGLCGYDATISFNGDTGSGFEYIGNKIQKNRPIYNIKGYTAAENTYYGVTWKSDDGANHSGTYYHTGRLKITNIDNNHPNHS